MKSDLMKMLNNQIVDYLYSAPKQEATIDEILPNIGLSRVHLNLVLCRMVHENLIYRTGPGVYKYRSKNRASVTRPLSENFNNSF